MLKFTKKWLRRFTERNPKPAMPSFQIFDTGGALRFNSATDELPEKFWEMLGAQKSEEALQHQAVEDHAPEMREDS